MDAIQTLTLEMCSYVIVIMNCIVLQSRITSKALHFNDLGMIRCILLACKYLLHAVKSTGELQIMLATFFYKYRYVMLSWPEASFNLLCGSYVSGKICNFPNSVCNSCSK